jgi:hypothetical protein
VPFVTRGNHTNTNLSSVCCALKQRPLRGLSWQRSQGSICLFQPDAALPACEIAGGTEGGVAMVPEIRLHNNSPIGHEQVLVTSLARVFDASLAPETCLEFPVFANLIQDFDSAR